MRSLISFSSRITISCAGVFILSALAIRLASSFANFASTRALAFSKPRATQGFDGSS